MQAKKELDEYLNDTLVNKLVESKVPAACRQGPCILGIDEAGRGPVLGPMVYGVAYYPQKGEDVLAKMKFADSKALTESTREDLFEAIQTRKGFEDLGYMVKIISPNMISNSMLRRKKYNLNALSHDTAIDLIRSVEAKGVKVAHVYVDTVGTATKYKEKLHSFFPNIPNFTVTEKADSKYAIVSAASVCAKVMRDRIVHNWRFAESDSLHLDAFKLGSGYPADPDTKKFLTDSMDPVFGFPTLARFSWSTITKLLDQSACKCDWNEPEDDEQDQKELSKQQAFFKNFVQRKKTPAKGSKAAAAPPGFPARPKTIEPPKARTNADKFFDDRMLSRQIVWNSS